MPAGDVDDATRSRGDRELRALVVADPGGESWTLLSNRLIRYAFPIVFRWIRSGSIHRRAAGAAASQPVPGLELVRHDLRLDGEDACELACDIVTRAVRAFPARLSTAWDPDKDPSLRNCFITCCLTELPSAHRDWSKRREHLDRRRHVPLNAKEISPFAARRQRNSNLKTKEKAGALWRRPTNGAREKESAE